MNSQNQETVLNHEQSLLIQNFVSIGETINNHDIPSSDSDGMTLHWIDTQDWEDNDYPDFDVQESLQHEDEQAFLDEPDDEGFEDLEDDNDFFQQDDVFHENGQLDLDDGLDME